MYLNEKLSEDKRVAKGVRLNHVREEKLTNNPEVESRLFFEKAIVETLQEENFYLVILALLFMRWPQPGSQIDTNESR